MKSTVLLFLLTITTAAAAAASLPSDFIRSSCSATLYPALCTASLGPYAPTVRHSPRRLADAALTVSADRARATARFVSRLTVTASKSLHPRVAGAIHDCIDTMADSVDRLRESVDEMGKLGRAGSERFEWHMSNVQTWVSAALTDETTCLDSLSQSGRAGAARVRSMIRKKVVEVAQVTSNGLALVNKIGA